MKNFKDFNIKPNIKNFVGDKIAIKRVFDKEIEILNYKIQPSKHKENTHCLYIQIKIKEEKRVIFTGSNSLMDQIKKVPENGFPFTTTIIKDNEYFVFT